jgi:hypothetical protein
MLARGLEGREQQFPDSLHVMEVGMRHFLGEAMRETRDIDVNMPQAVSIAEKIAPWYLSSDRTHGL